MTRITNFGRKRTYVEAGFANVVKGVEQTISSPQELLVKHGEEDAEKALSKKKQRTKKPEGTGEEVGTKRPGSEDGDQEPSTNAPKNKRREKRKEQRLKSRSERATQSETRRNKRIAVRQASTICFACREKGHAAKDCPVTLSHPSDGAEANSNGRNAVGICYRCGSKKHSLSRCKKPVDESNPLPYASCFVCLGKGHLASSCPQNKAKGVYPNGGCCKLCGDNSHLARNCGLRKDDETNNSSMMLGTGREAGADEDDFHTFKRRKAEVDKVEKIEENVKHLMDIKAGAHSGTVKAFGKTPADPVKKVVYF